MRASALLRWGYALLASVGCSVGVQLLPLKRMTAGPSAIEWHHAQNWAQALVTLRPVGPAAASGAAGESCSQLEVWKSARAWLWGAQLQAGELHTRQWAAPQPPVRQKPAGLHSKAVTQEVICRGFWLVGVRFTAQEGEGGPVPIK